MFKQYQHHTRDIQNADDDEVEDAVPHGVCFACAGEYSVRGAEYGLFPFTVASPAAVPGAALAPGAYTLHVVNRLSDRVLLKVDGANGSVSTTFLGVESPGVTRKPGGGAVMWSKEVSGAQYMKGWSFAGSQKPVEFVYPKDDAVKIATANLGTVPAVDPASEGKPTDNTITQNDMQLLNL
jgi:hypothetical protein